MDINRDIQRWRLANQGIAEAVARSPAEVVESLGAVQAQDYLGSLWAFGLRLPSVTETIVEQAIIERAILRTWPMRGTLHFVRSADVRWMLDLLTPRIIARRAFTDRQFGIDSKMLARSEKLFVNALRGDKQLPREKMYELLESASISTAAQRGLHIVGRLAMEGLLCFGARNGKQQTFALLDEWAPSAKRLERNEALAQLALRYFRGHGPATLQDFAWWSGLTMSDARAGVESVAAQLAKETIDGEIYWLPESGLVPRNRQNRCYLLPSYDEYLVGYKNRQAALAPEHHGAVFPGNMFNAVIVIGGRVQGTWKRTVAKDRAIVTSKLFGRSDREAQRALTTVVKRYGVFLGVPAQIPGD